MSTYGAGPKEAGTVGVRVQVIDIEPFSLDMTVPTYLPARDLTQRVARDAGLGAFWPDGTRRKFYLRARGELLSEEDTLADYGVVQGELLHLLPEPPPGSSVEERAPNYPTVEPKVRSRLRILGVQVVVLGFWTLLWGMALSVLPGAIVGLVPGLGLAMLCVATSRRIQKTRTSALRVPLVGLAIYLVCAALAASGAALYLSAEEQDLSSLWVAVGYASFAALPGILVGWLSWYGAVEPLPEVTEAEALAASALVTYPCAICTLPVEVTAVQHCQYGCGRVFHQGCFQARVAVAASEGCAVCGYVPQAV